MRIARRIITDGIFTGVAAFVAVAIAYSVLDVLAARGPFFTADLLGRVLFQGLRDPAFHMFPHGTELAAVLCCAGLHFPLSLLVGLTVSAAASLGERRALRRPDVLLLLATGGGSVLLAAGLLMSPFAAVLPSSSILAANGLAATAATSLLLRRRGWLSSGR